MQIKSLWPEKAQKASRIVVSGLQWMRPTPSLDWSITFLYLTVLFLGNYWLIMHAIWWSIPPFIATILLLFLLDHLEYQYYENKTPTRKALLFLGLRFLCVTFAVLLSPSYSTMLYLFLPFRTMLYFGNKAAYGMAVLIVSIDIASLWLDPRLDHSEADINFASVFCIICIWSILKAQGTLRERAGQQREYDSRIRAEALLKEVRRSHQQLQIYSEQVATLATTQERNRVAREIHDSLGHSLTAIHLQLEKALVYYEDHPQEALQSVRDARDVSKEALQEVRHSVSALRTEDKPFSCVREIALLAEQLRLSGLTVRFAAAGSEEAFSRQILTTLYRITQEGCTNIQRHAKAREVQISLTFEQQEARMYISDDGIGFDTSSLEQREKSQQSYGLLGMQERLLLVNGYLQLESIPGQGTYMTATISKRPVED